jgi:uncharacterized protein
MIPRTLAIKFKQAIEHYPVVTLTGPRQSGKTTLARTELPHYEYVSLELPEHRSFALKDPRGFLGQFKKPVILDEAQRAPDLFSYIQTLVDEHNQPGQYILTGSQNFLLLQSITQSLAGRCAILHLLPFSLSELLQRDAISLDHLGQKTPESRRLDAGDLIETLFKGFYPRIHDKKLSPQDWLGNYYQTYLERDVRNVLQVGDLETFGRFVQLCAGRNGQLLNLSGLASDCGVTHTTAKRWLSVLEASFLVHLLRHHHKNFGKRRIKSPKIHFRDTGLLCYLLKIKGPQELFTHASRGTIFESFVFSEIYKNYLNLGQRPNVYFWRDAQGHEIDLILDRGQELFPVEIKSAQTIAEDFFDGLKNWYRLDPSHHRSGALIYGGDLQSQRGNTTVHPWCVL